MSEINVALAGGNFVYSSEDPDDVFHMIHSHSGANKPVRIVEFHPAGGVSVRPLTPDENARWSYNHTPPRT